MNNSNRSRPDMFHNVVFISKPNLQTGTVHFYSAAYPPPQQYGQPGSTFERLFTVNSLCLAIQGITMWPVL